MDTIRTSQRKIDSQRMQVATGQELEVVIIMTLDGGVAQYLSHMQNGEPAASHIFISNLFKKRMMIQE